MTNLDQHSALYGTGFGVMGPLGDLLKNSPTLTSGVLITDCSKSSMTARRIRRRNRQFRMQ